MDDVVEVHAVDAALRGPVDGRARELLALPEDQWFERKSNRISARSLAQSWSALANADGGILIVGLHGGKVEGIEAMGSKLNDLQQALRDFCAPRVHAKSRSWIASSSCSGTSCWSSRCRPAIDSI